MSRPVIDLDPDSRRALEFDELLAWVSSLARTAEGGGRIRALEPLAEAAAVAAEIEAVAEAGRYLEERGMLLPGLLPDTRAAVEALAVVGKRLDPLSLRDLAAVARAAGQLRSSLLELPAAGHLSALGRSLPDLDREAGAVLGGMDPEGRITDEASPELRGIRSSKARLGERLRALLERILSDPESGPVIRDEFITQRNGRFVVPVRTDAPRPMRGIVHASSSSGATRFIEPLESVELNNELVRLAEREQEEEERILLVWSDAFRRRLEEVRQAVEGVAVADALQARALFAGEAQALWPQVTPGGPLELADIRHPLLDRLLRAQGGGAVPLSIALDPADRVLVLSGPNTGGKTVALKTLGLAVLMAQSGIPVTASAARLPLYRQVRADIGDHQSIAADLSTYSAHIRAVAGVLRTNAPPALFLFDEIGTGTEPNEGAALAVSILESLIAPGVTAMATTHLAALKAWAFTTDGARSAAMDFDTGSLQPTYRILMDAAGTSAGLAIAERLGLARAIVDRARSRLGSELLRTEEYLSRLRASIDGIEHEREALRKREQELVEERQSVAALGERTERQRRSEAAEALDRALGELRQRGREELDAVRDRRERVWAERELAKSERRLLAQHARLKAELAPSAEQEIRAGWTEPAALDPGMAVYVRSLGREGQVVRTRGGSVDVLLGQAVFSVARADLRVPPATGPGPSPARRGIGAAPQGRSAGRLPAPSWTVAPERVVPRELLLLGKTVEDALVELDKFLDDAVLAGHDEVRVVHGHGTGRLRLAVRRFLDAHAHVQGWRAGSPAEGGDGATVVGVK